MESPSNDAGALLQDAGLRCPQCGYNLTGLGENRCPECGAEFDPVALRRLVSGQPAPVPGWDDGGNFLIAFVRTCVATWFDNLRFGERFPPCYSRSSAFRFRTAALFVALFIFVSGAIIRHQAPGIALAAIPGMVVGVVLCEALILVATLITEPRAGLVKSSHPDAACSWRGLIGFYRSWLMVNSVVTWLPTSGLLPFLILVPGLWWLTLALALTGASRLTFGRVIAIVMMPLCAGIGAIVGYALSFFLGLFAFEAGLLR